MNEAFLCNAEFVGIYLCIFCGFRVDESTVYYALCLIKSCPCNSLYYTVA